MIVYSSTKAQFQADVLTNDIGKIILDVYTAKTGCDSGKSEIDSWINSLPFMNTVLNDPEIPDDAGVAIEYHIPQTSKRIDFILTGEDEQQQDTAVLVTDLEVTLQHKHAPLPQLCHNARECKSSHAGADDNGIEFAMGRNAVYR